jgi:hypothetical protein
VELVDAAEGAGDAVVGFELADAVGILDHKTPSEPSEHRPPSGIASRNQSGFAGNDDRN